MKIFTNKGFQEEVYKKIEEREEHDFVRRKFAELEERIEGLYREIGELKHGTADRPMRIRSLQHRMR